MGEIAKISAGALTVPDTLTTYELGAPIPKAVQDFVIKHFVLPVLLKYDGGRGLPDHEKSMILAEYAEDVVGFMPEAYRLAVKLMGRDRKKGNWRPDPGECRDWLQRAENEICARTGKPRQVRDQEQLRRAMLGALCGVDGMNIQTDEPSGTKKTRWVSFPTTWERDRLGPMPTEYGCRLDAALQRECWLARFRFDQVGYEHDLAVHASGHGVESPSKAAELRARARELEKNHGIKVSPPTCAILRGVMAARQVPMTPEEIAAADAEVADYYARLEAEAAADKERERLRREQEEAKHKARLEQEEAWRRAEQEKRDRRHLEELASHMASVSPEVVEARKVLRANTGAAGAFERFASVLQAVTDREMQHLQSDPAYIGECSRNAEAHQAADKDLRRHPEHQQLSRVELT